MFGFEFVPTGAEFINRGSERRDFGRSKKLLADEILEARSVSAVGHRSLNFRHRFCRKRNIILDFFQKYRAVFIAPRLQLARAFADQSGQLGVFAGQVARGKEYSLAHLFGRAAFIEHGGELLARIARNFDPLRHFFGQTFGQSRVRFGALIHEIFHVFGCCRKRAAFGDFALQESAQTFRAFAGLGAFGDCIVSAEFGF